MSDRYFTAVFDDEHDLLEAVTTLRKQKYSIVDVFTPYAVHGLEKAAGLKHSRLGWVCAIAGLASASLMLWFEIWTSSTDWAINVGGKPFASVPAFIPAMFELGVAGGGLASVFALFLVSRLYPGKTPQIPRARVTDDQFAIVIDEKDAGFDREVTAALLRRLGAIQTYESVEGVAA